MTDLEYAIEVEGLEFEHERAAAPGSFRLRIDRWRVPRGHRVALHGPSGCGKTTVLDLLAGARRPTRGRLQVEGRELTEMTEAALRAHRIRHLGFVFQDFPLVEYLDARENVLLPFRLNPALELGPAHRERADRLLSDLGLAQRGDRRPGRLSQGERQRVAIARALVTEPTLLLADEPTAGLDPEQGMAVLELLERLCEVHSLTLVLVSHDPAVLARFDETRSVREWSAT